MTGSRLRILDKPMKAFEQEHDPPFLGDVRPTVDLPVGFDLNKLENFEVWDGKAWRKPDDLIYNVQK